MEATRSAPTLFDSWPGRRLGVDGVNAGFRFVPKGSRGSRDFVRGTNGSRWFHTVWARFESRHLHLIMALTCGNAAIGVELPSRLLFPWGSRDLGVSGASAWPIWRQIGSSQG